MNTSKAESDGMIIEGEESTWILTTIEAAELLNQIQNGAAIYNIMTPETCSKLVENGLLDWSPADYGATVTPKGKKFVDKFLPDERNLSNLFSMTATEMLVLISSGVVNPINLARLQLAARGLDQSGKWVGFEKAEKIAKQRNAAD
jgi:hypothetical protein